MTKLADISLDELEKLAAIAPYAQPIKMMLAIKRNKLHQAHLYQSDHIADTHLYSVIRGEADSIIENLEIPVAVPMAPVVIKTKKNGKRDRVSAEELTETIEIEPGVVTESSEDIAPEIEKLLIEEPVMLSTIHEDQSPSIGEITEYTSTMAGEEQSDKPAKDKQKKKSKKKKRSSNKKAAVLKKKKKKKSKNKESRVNTSTDDQTHLSAYSLFLLEQDKDAAITPLTEKKVKSKAKKKKKKKKSKKNRQEVVSEPLAELLVKQGYIQEAVVMYERLSLIIPEKSSFFAATIEKLSKKF